ncbi:hypothetical protein KEJ37_03270 [Candidatus Bathyarchaeota archaeon]|nr:hypothetical protein [Candidatus Bathyarchaeota archaeon]
MATNHKILKALESAANYLEKSASALGSGDENSFTKHFWHVAAELEYALFMFSLIFQEENIDKSKWKPNPDVKKDNINGVLTEVYSLLDNAKKSLTSGKLLDAYKGVYLARHRVFAVEENLAKKKRERSKGK